MAPTFAFPLKSLQAAAALVALLALGSVQAQGFRTVSASTEAGEAATATASPLAPDVSAVAPTVPVVGVPLPVVDVMTGADAPVTLGPLPTPPLGGRDVASGPGVATVAAATGAFSSGSFSSVSGGSVANVPVPAEPASSFGAGASSGFELAEKVVVDKSERTLYLMRRGRTIKQYPIKLGLNPYGHKQREGDFRTPEGKYELVARNPRSEYFLSIRISYPNREDAAVANENGYPPGGLIMIHGQPNVPKRSAEHYATRDWTDGCIALSNDDMVEVWMRTTVGIPIEIKP